MSAPREKHTPARSSRRTDQAGVVPIRPDVIELPPGVNRREWRETRGFGTDGKRTFRLADGEWSLLVESHVRITAARAAAADPDFPDRAEDGDDSNLEASTDVLVMTDRAGKVRSKVYRNVRMSNLRKLTPLDQFGPTAWTGARLTNDGRAILAQAVIALSEAYGLPEQDFYPRTGWYPNESGPGELFVHGGGAIGPAGVLADAEVRVGDQLAALRLGEPATGPALVESFAECLALVECGALPGRVFAPLLGVALRPLFGVYVDPSDPRAEAEASAGAWITGGTGGGKSGALASVLNAVYPGLRYNRYPFKAGTQKNGGASGAALERLGFNARDLVLPFDDLDPSESDADRAAWQSNLLRSAFGGYSRLLAQRGGTDNRQALPWRAGVIGTGEPLDSEASAENRAVNVPINAGDVMLGELRARTGAAERMTRGQLGAGVVRAIAGNRAEYRARLSVARKALRALFVAGEAPGPIARGADVFAEVAATLWVVLCILVDNGLTVADGRRHWSTLRAGLLDAWRAHLSVIGGGDRASRAVVYLRQALAAGHLRLDDKGEGQGNPSRDMYGWETRMTGSGQYAAPETRPAAVTVGGYQDATTGDLFLMPSIATAAVKRVADQAGDSWTGSTKTIAEALKAGGYLHIPASRARDGAATAVARVGGKSRAWWHVRADRFEGTDQADETQADYSGPVDTAGLPCAALFGAQDGPQPADQAGPVESPPDADPGPGVATQGPDTAGPVITTGDPEPCEACGRATPLRQDGRPRHLHPCPAPGEPDQADQDVTGKDVQLDRDQADSEAFATDVAVDDAKELARFARVIRDGARGGDPDATDADIEAAYRIFREVTGGVRMIRDPGGTGIAWWRWVRERNHASVRTEPLQSELLDGITRQLRARFADHLRPGESVEVGQIITGLDVNGQFPAGAASVLLGHGEPDHFTTARSIRVQTERPGWFRKGAGYVRLGADLSTDHPAFDDLRAGDWLGLPSVGFLLDPGKGTPAVIEPDALDIAELVYWGQGNHGTRLAAWQAKFRDARAALIGRDDVPARYALDVLKTVANTFLGGYLRSERYAGGSEILRPDWSDMLITQAGANMLRAEWKSQHIDGNPAAIGAYRDALWFIGDEPFTPAGKSLEISTQLGKFKREKIVTVTDEIAAAYASESHKAMVDLLAQAHREGR